MRRVLLSSASQARLEQGIAWLAEQPRALVLGPSLEAAAEVARRAALRKGASFGWQRFTLPRFAALLARPLLDEQGLATLSPLGLAAVCAQVVHRLAQAGALGRFQPIADRPGFPRALASTLSELRLAGARPEGELGRILDSYEAELRAQKLADRARVFQLALEAEHELLSLPALLVDLQLGSPLEARLVGRLRGEVLALTPRGEAEIARALEVAVEELPEPHGRALSRVQRGLFEESVEPAPLDGSVALLSAPGEARECVEIARLARRYALRGVPFDEMAIFLRSPAQYRPLLEEAFGRAGIPVHFAAGTQQPHPAGRAFLTLLACAQEGLSARRLAEYLSLGEVPNAVQGAPPAPLPPEERFEPADTELSPRASAIDEPDPPPAENPDAPVVDGSLRAPWRWEHLLLDAAVIGGKERFARRLDVLEARLREDLARHREDEARAAGIQRQLDDTDALRAFALPLVEELDALPETARWGEWLARLAALATRCLRQPARVLALLQELAPMAEVGPVSLAGVQLVLAQRLGEVTLPPRKRRQGAVYVAEAAAARGLSFAVVFVPGIAEKLFPRKVLEDPLLRDLERATLPGLASSRDRIASERQLLRLSVSAARERAVFSWPRLDLSQGRARVPSFYGLEVLRAAEGKLLSFAELSLRAEGEAQSRAGWPAPLDARDAIDEAEHDLALLARALQQSESERRGAFAYLLKANPHLGRALRARARRWHKSWTQADGLVKLGVDGLAALRKHLPSARPYSPTALQNYASCPYRFALQAVHRLAPREVPEAIDELDPISRGALIHEVQFELLSALRDGRALPLNAGNLAAAQAKLEEVLAQVAERWRDKLAPALESVWRDGITSIAADLREWLRQSASDERWTPWRFELSFGLELEHRDPHSSEKPIQLDEGLLVRGSIDLVERAQDGALRATDYKTGRAWAKDGVVIGGGATLQPALYALVLEKLFAGARVEGGRLYYCTYAGDFTPVEVALDAQARGSIHELAQTISRAIDEGFLPAAPKPPAPGRASECARCDYQLVCGPDEDRRTARKPREPLAPLTKLRELP